MNSTTHHFPSSFLFPLSLFLASRGQVKLTDFGIARMLENTVAMCATVVGTFKYMSPERIMSKKYVRFYLLVYLTQMLGIAQLYSIS